MSWNSLQSSWRLARSYCSVRLRLGPLEREDAAGEVGKRFQVADRLEVAAGHDRRKAQLLGLLGGGRAGDQGGDPLAHLLEVPAAPVDAGHAGLDQQAALEELPQQRRLVGAGRAWAGHQTSLAISSRLAFV